MDQEIDLSSANSDQVEAHKLKYEMIYPSLFQKYQDQDFGMDDVIKMLGGSCGCFQIFSTVVFIIIFAVGSQFFYSMPFYQ